MKHTKGPEMATTVKVSAEEAPLIIDRLLEKYTEEELHNVFEYSSPSALNHWRAGKNGMSMANSRIARRLDSDNPIPDMSKDTEPLRRYMVIGIVEIHAQSINDALLELASSGLTWKQFRIEVAE